MILKRYECAAALLLLVFGAPAALAQTRPSIAQQQAQINSLATRIGKLDGTTPTADADIVGTYGLAILQVGIGWTGGPADVEAISYDGTATLAADHTFTAASTGHKNDNGGPSPDDGQVTGTWSLAGNVLSLTNPANPSTTSLHCTPGCRVIVGTDSGAAAMLHDAGFNNMLVFVRSD